MGELKNGFILYYDFREQTAELSNAEVGELLRAVLDYEIDRVLPEFENSMLTMAFKFLKIQLDKNRQRYEQICEQNRKNRGGKKKLPNNDGEELEPPPADDYYQGRVKMPTPGKDFSGIFRPTPPARPRRCG